MSHRADVKLALILMDELVAEAVAAGRCPPGMDCAPDFPTEDDRIAAALFLERCAAGLDPRPYGVHLVALTDPGSGSLGAGIAVGSIGFHGGVDDRGRVEIGYAIAPSQRGRGHATQALGQLAIRARANGANTLVAEVRPGPLAQVSAEVLRRNGFTQADTEGRTRLFERSLG